MSKSGGISPAFAVYFRKSASGNLIKAFGFVLPRARLYSIKKELLEFADWSLQMRGYGL